MPSGDQPNPPRGDGAAAVQLFAPGPAPVPPRAAPDAPTRDPKVVAAARYRRRVLLVLAAIAAAAGLYWGSSYLFAYTDDAYLTSDLVAVAPQITGRIVTVPITDNETVKQGMLLAAIDPQPFRLALAEQQARRVEAEAQLAVDHDLVKSAKAAREEAAAKERMANDNLRRARPVAAAGFVSRQALEDAATQQQEAAAALAGAEDVVVKARQTETLHEATVKAITAQIAYLQWQLDQTRLLAPVDGTITNLTLRVGDQAVANQPLIGLVDAHAWRILANYKESVIRHIQIGHTAWVWLDTYPWHVHRAVIQGIARGISRAPTPNTLLPYVAPTTDWIRLERRFPVTLVLRDPDPEITLHMGSDARTLIFY
ncbi:MAG TPA: HlyD family secretion protein [Stellaceae bacterium]|jgi:multidrug efflux system membrane fusion protein